MQLVSLYHFVLRMKDTGVEAGYTVPAFLSVAALEVDKCIKSAIRKLSDGIKKKNPPKISNLPALC